jgi:hypothetical protein
MKIKICNMRGISHNLEVSALGQANPHDEKMSRQRIEFGGARIEDKGRKPERNA